jgi:hypothetical protein|uniref:putative signal transducing protein n=1 Tax=Polaribacter sp. TaxID=1920175 RepID=UPI0040470B73
MNQEEHIKIFSENGILVRRLQSLLEEEQIPSLIKDNVESARLGGFGSFQNSVDLFIFKSDLEKATPIIETFQKEISE